MFDIEKIELRIKNSKIIINRIKELEKQNFLLESFFLKISLIESILLFYIAARQVIEGRILEEHLGIENNIKNKIKKLKKLSLGTLVGIFEEKHDRRIKVFSKDLIKELKEYVELRNKISHNLVAGNLDSILKDFKSIENDNFFILHTDLFLHIGLMLNLEDNMIVKLKKLAEK